MDGEMTEDELRDFLGPWPKSMAPAQREWCLREIDAVEGHSREDYEAGGDADLARGVLRAWRDFAMDKGLL